MANTWFNKKYAKLVVRMVNGSEYVAGTYSHDVDDELEDTSAWTAYLALIAALEASKLAPTTKPWLEIPTVTYIIKNSQGGKRQYGDDTDVVAPLSYTKLVATAVASIEIIETVGKE